MKCPQCDAKNSMTAYLNTTSVANLVSMEPQLLVEQETFDVQSIDLIRCHECNYVVPHEVYKDKIFVVHS